MFEDGSLKMEAARPNFEDGSRINIY